MSYPRFGRFVVLLLNLALMASCGGVSAERQPPPELVASNRTATPTPDAATLDTIAAVIAGTQAVTQTSTSPDGVWQVQTAMYDCIATNDSGDDSSQYAFEALYLTHAGTRMSAQLDSQLINCGGLGAHGFRELCWSPDSRYFYYDMAREGVPDGNGEWTAPIRQLEVGSGMIRELTGTTTATGGNQKETLCSSTQP
jgi:hypothetical protein